MLSEMGNRVIEMAGKGGPSARHTDLLLGQTLKSKRDTHGCVTGAANVILVSRLTTSRVYFGLLCYGFSW